MAKLEEYNNALKIAVKSHQPCYGNGLTTFDFLSSMDKGPDAEPESSTAPAEDSRSDLIAKYNDLLSRKTRNRRVARAREQKQRAFWLNPPASARHEGRSEDGCEHDEFITALTIDTQISKSVIRSMTGHSDNAKRMVATTLLGLPRPVIDKISADPAAAVAALTEKPIEGPSTYPGGSTEFEAQEWSASSAASSSSSPEEAESLPEKAESIPVQTVRPEGTPAPTKSHSSAISAK